jgi:hypothetical protein
MAAAYNDIFGCGVPEQEARDCEAAATLSILSKRPASVLTPSAPEFKRLRLSPSSDVDLDAEVPEEPESPRLLSTVDAAAIERLKIKVRKLKAESQEFQTKFYELQEKYLRQKSRARKENEKIVNNFKTQLLEMKLELRAEKSDRRELVKNLERYEALPLLNLTEPNPLTARIKETERTLSTFKPTFAQQPPVVALPPPSEIFDDVDGFDAAAEFQETFDAAVAVAAAAAADEAEEEAAADAAAAFAIADAAGFYRTDAGDNDFERPVQQDQELVEDYILRLSSWEALYMY